MIFIISLQSSEDRASIKTTQESIKATNTTKTTTTITKKKKKLSKIVLLYILSSAGIDIHHQKTAVVIHT